VPPLRMSDNLKDHLTHLRSPFLQRTEVHPSVHYTFVYLVGH